MNDSELDPRTVRTRQLAVEATAELLVEHGFEQTNVEAIAERVGVARSTIYRAWPDRIQLYIAAINHIRGGPHTDVPNEGSLEANLRALGHGLLISLTQAPWGKVLRSLIAAAARDEDLNRAYLQLCTRQLEKYTTVIQQAIDQGELPPDTNPAELGQRFAANFFYTQLMLYQPIDETFVDQEVKALLRSAR